MQSAEERLRPPGSNKTGRAGKMDDEATKMRQLQLFHIQRSFQEELPDMRTNFHIP